MRYFIPEEYYEQETRIVNAVDQIRHRTVYDFNYSSYDCEESVSSEQLVAINGVLNAPLSVLSGKGGTGKTCCVVKNVVNKIKQHGDKYMLLAPTHAAKKNAQKETSGESSQYQTIHSHTYPYFLQHTMTTSCKLRDYFQEQPHSCRVYVFIEEASMVDRELFSRLFSTCADYDNVRVVLLGDDNQLPAIGGGQIFFDLMNCTCIPTYELTINFRAKHSDIPRFCEMILGESEYGQDWDIGTMSDNPFQNVKYHFGSGINIADIESVLTRYREEGYVPSGVNSSQKKIQVITNVNKTCERLVPSVRKVFNTALRNTPQCVANTKYAINDPVLLTKNNTIFNNGDNAILTYEHADGYIVQLTETDINRQVSDQDKREYQYECTDGVERLVVSKNDIKPMLARTVHSTQGLGFDVVLYVLDTDYPLNKNMQYTAYSRAKEYLHLFGSHNYFNGKNARKTALTRQSFIAQWLADLCPVIVPKSASFTRYPNEI